MKCHQKSHLGRSSVASAASGFVEVGPGGRWQAKSSGSHQRLSNIWISSSKVGICSIWSKSIEYLVTSGETTNI